MNRMRLVSLIGFFGVGIILSGCGSPVALEFRYRRPAEIQISQRIKRIAIAEFTGNRQWGGIASDQILSLLDEYNRKYHRYELVDRARLADILKQHDLNLAISDSAAAVQAGKIAGVDAMIYGRVRVASHDEHTFRRVYDPIAKRMKTVPHLRRYCRVAVNFTLDDIQTGKVIVTISSTREYDSDKSGGHSFSSMMGFSGKIPPADKVIMELINQCVHEFVNKISPHEYVVVEKLKRGKSKLVRAGNEFAAAGDFSTALKYYQDAFEMKPEDDGAMFNAGVICEAMGKMKEAAEYYNKAIQIKPKRQYIRARRRVLTEQTPPVVRLHVKE